MLTQAARQDPFPRLHAKAMSTGVAAWSAGLLVAASCIWAGGQWSLAEFAAVSVGSLLVSILALVPGMLRFRNRDQPMGDVEAGLLSVGSGMIFRLGGTVALFLCCRYHMATSDRVVAVWVLGWYLVLTTVELITIGRFAAQSGESSKAMTSSSSTP
ncbi:MAG: hypothetical protein AAGA03_05905 [Planctomycetota bacterium]